MFSPIENPDTGIDENPSAYFQTQGGSRSLIGKNTKNLFFPTILQQPIALESDFGAQP
jgi:hypothetical protein